MKVLFEDASFVVISKPHGLLSIPGRGPENQDCVASRVQAMYSDCTDHPCPHRLDMDTAGIMVVARTKDAHKNLSVQFQDRKVHKRYIAVLDGLLRASSGIVDLPLRMDFFNRPYQVYDPLHGKKGLTEWRTLSEENGRTRVEFTPITGRTHQLRVHAAHSLGLNTPIKGDRLYGVNRENEPLLLHAAYLQFTHPVTGECLTFSDEPAF